MELGFRTTCVVGSFYLFEPGLRRSAAQHYVIAIPAHTGTFRAHVRTPDADFSRHLLRATRLVRHAGIGRARRPAYRPAVIPSYPTACRGQTRCSEWSRMLCLPNGSTRLRPRAVLPTDSAHARPRLDGDCAVPATESMLGRIARPPAALHPGGAVPRQA